MSFNVSARYCSFAKSKRNNNKLTRTNTHRNTLHSIFELAGGFAKSRSNLEIICMNLFYEFSFYLQWQQIVFPKMWRKKLPGTEQIFLCWMSSGILFCLVFGSWFRITKLVVKFVSHNRTFLHASHVYRLYCLCPPHLSNILASRHGSNHTPTPITGGGTRKIQTKNMQTQVVLRCKRQCGCHQFH